MENDSGAPKITILIAEDEEPLRNLVERILRRGNKYILLVAKDGDEALGVADRHEGRIDLLLSNVQMPGLTGPELARKLKQKRPEMRVVLMSGYGHGLWVLDHGWSFLQKPFLPSAMHDRIHQVLSDPTPEEDWQN